MATEVQFDPGQFRALMAAIKAFDAKLATKVRRELRRAGDDAVADIKATVQSGPGSGRVGIRAGIAAGTKTTVATSKSAQGVRISSSSSALPAGHKPMLRAYNKAEFRHPVYGRDTWVSQSGRPFFGVVIKRHEEAMRAAVLAALGDAVKEIMR
jgi:hypothetical protein